MEVCIGDMLVKSKQVENHTTNQVDMFTILKEYGMKLNPKKCVFGVSLGKFLGYMVNQYGIEANLDKIKA